MAKYTKDKLIDELLVHNREVAKYMSNIAGALSNVNDSNILHTSSITDNTSAIKDMARINSSFLSFFRWILAALILAVIVLAGAEKVLKFLPQFG